jgi:hypothetical protein
MSSAQPYQDYLVRFERLIGAVAVGAYGTFRGKLVRKLSPEEFQRKFDELTSFSEQYNKILERGDTLNDALTKLLRERQAELLISEEGTRTDL